MLVTVPRLVMTILALSAGLCLNPILADEISVSSLDLDKLRQDYGSPAADRSVDKNPLIVHETKFKSGIGTHANSMLFIDLHGTATRFQASVGVDDEEKGSIARVQFYLFGDGKQLWQSSDLRPGSPAEKVDVPLTGIKILNLSIAATGDTIDYDHADWLEPTIEYSGTAPLAINVPAVEHSEVGILTPAAPRTPQINGAKVLGVHPGHPFLFTIPATGDRPLIFSADGLPPGLQLDAATGEITGLAPKAGNYEVSLHAQNALGTSSRPMLIKVGNTINLTPQMGWNSWNCFAGEVSDARVRIAADAMIKDHLIEHGWAYINIDDFWEINPSSKDAALHGPERNPDGTIHPNSRFPDMKALADYIHSKGLKAGLYSSPGTYTCGGCAASYQHETQDVESYSKWGFDYLKYDWCSYGDVYQKEFHGQGFEGMKRPYQVMGDAIAAAPRDIVFSMCQYGMGDVWKWGADVGGNSWRTTGDIADHWTSMWGNAQKQIPSARYCQPGHFNDPDMLIVGRIGWGNPKPTSLTQDEQYTHISLWCLLSAPLLIGCDMSNMDPFTLGLLTNDEVLAVDQDALGKQATPIPGVAGPVFAKPLEDGSWAVGLFNSTPLPRRVSVKWSDLKLTGRYTVRDLWRQKDIDTNDLGFTSTVASHGVMLIRLRRSD